MATAVPSRFACLKIEDDDYRPRNPNKEKENKKKTKTPSVKASDNKKIASNKGTNKNAQGKSNAQPKKKKTEKTAEQWEQWKQKDNELVDGCYEDDLQQALLLSKLEYEEKKQTNKQGKKTSEPEKKQDTEIKKNKGKSKAMSLDQFNNMVSGTNSENQRCSNDQTPEDEIENGKEFFTRLEMDTRGELTKEHMRETVLARQPPTTEVITSSQYKEQLAKKDEEIRNLQTDIVDLKAELLMVKTRNKKLCSILGQGEMRDKAEVLVEVDRLTRVQTELTAEVQSLHAQLEQEKSKVHYLTEKDHKGKDKKKRDNASAKASD